MVAPVMLTAEDIANRMTANGTPILPQTWRRYVYGGRAPQPDGYVGRTPQWRASTYADWLKNRPGRGTGGGRPPKVRVTEGGPAEAVPGQMTVDDALAVT